MIKVIIEKYEKTSLGEVYKTYGAGILLVGIINPFADAKELINAEKPKILHAIKLKDKRFNEMYFYDVNDHAFCKLM